MIAQGPDYQNYSFGFSISPTWRDRRIGGVPSGRSGWNAESESDEIVEKSDARLCGDSVHLAKEVVNEWSHGQKRFSGSQPRPGLPPSLQGWLRPAQRGTISKGASRFPAAWVSRGSRPLMRLLRTSLRKAWRKSQQGTR